MKQSEHQLQSSIVHFLHTHNIITINCDVMDVLRVIGGTKRNSDRFPAIIHARKMGYTKGQPDLIAIADRAVCLEVKTMKGRQSKEQKELSEKIKLRGVEYYIVRSVEDVAKIFGLNMK